MADASAPAARRPCRHFQRGTCLYGAKCGFLHDAAAAKAAADAAAPSAEAAAEAAALDALLAEFSQLQVEVNTLRRGGAPRDELLAAVEKLDAMRTKVKAVRGPKPRSRYATRPRVRNKERAGALRRFLLDTYGLEALQAGAGVLDVAGGSGSLAFELRNLNGVAVTVVDPRPLTLRKLLRKWRSA